jgi:hypothetical protein
MKVLSVNLSYLENLKFKLRELEENGYFLWFDFELSDWSCFKGEKWEDSFDISGWVVSGQDKNQVIETAFLYLWTR